MAIGRRAVAEAELSVLLRDAAGLLAEMLDAEYCGIAARTADGAEIELQLFPARSQPSQPERLLHRYSSNGAESLAAFAIQAAHPVVTANLAQDPRFRDLFLERQGIRSSIVVPLTVQGRGSGALAAYSRRERSFSGQDAPFAETIAHLLSTTMARKQAEETLACERRTSSEILQAIEAMVLMLDAEGRILFLNRAVQELTGFSLDDVYRRPIWELFPVAEEANLFAEIFRRLRQGIKSVEYESSMLTIDATRRRIAWSYGAIYGPGGNLESVAATGIDVSGQRAAEGNLQRAEQVIQQLRQESALPGSPGAETRGGGSPAETITDSPATESVSAGDQASDTGGIDRRQRQRRPYPFKQAIAPIVDGKIPAAQDFIDVQCHDISAGGFSFLSVGPPASDSFVIVLGQPPNVTHVTAQVVHVRRVEQGGRRMYLIGCNYTGRIA